MRRWRIRPWRALALALAALLACEALLWAVGYNWLSWYRPDRELGWVLRPGLSGWYVGEGRAVVRINSAGYRDREHALEKPAGVYRIAVLGDAYAEAMQVPLEASFWAELPKRLESCSFAPGKRIEVLNFGVRDYGTAQQYLVLEKSALRYRPDLVLLQFSHGNDLRDNYAPLDPVGLKPYFTVAADGALELDDSFASGKRYARRASDHRELLARLVNHSRVLQLARHAGVELRDEIRARGRRGRAPDRSALAPPRDARWTEAWRITEALIARIGEVAARNGARAGVIAVPFPFAVDPDAAARERLAAGHAATGLTYVDQRVVEFARHNGMYGIMLQPDMATVAEATRSELYLHKGHWNELGHRTAAEVIARSLCAEATPAGAGSRAGAAPSD